MDLPATQVTASKTASPRGLDWNNIVLADTWPDTLNLRSLQGWRELLRAMFGNQRNSVELPADFGVLDNLPKYLLQEFHNLPNGNYSRRFSRGYITGFDLVMRGRMQIARRWIAQQLQNREAVLDVGTAGGRTAAAIKAVGVQKVWGLDPSPYLLKHAASDYQNIDFIPGLAEDLPFSDESLDGISLCFVLHEIPPKYIKQALGEFYRTLRPGGKLVIAEPSHQQLEPISWRELLQIQGWSKLYFKFLAKRVYEPFLDAWHRLDKPALITAAGFAQVESHQGMPVAFWVAEKPM
jgi:ubiquinone/menaquinone biosynthesis C-methylase UbiE